MLVSIGPRQNLNLLELAEETHFILTLKNSNYRMYIQGNVNKTHLTSQIKDC